METKVADYTVYSKEYKSANMGLTQLGKDLEGQRSRVDELEFRKQAAGEKKEILERRRESLLKDAAQGVNGAEKKLDAFREEHSKQCFEMDNLDEMLTYAKTEIDEKMKEIMTAENRLAGIHRRLCVNIADNAKDRLISECRDTVKIAWAFSNMTRSLDFKEWLFGLFKDVQDETTTTIGLDFPRHPEQLTSLVPHADRQRLKARYKPTPPPKTKNLYTSSALPSGSEPEPRKEPELRPVIVNGADGIHTHYEPIPAE